MATGEPPSLFLKYRNWDEGGKGDTAGFSKRRPMIPLDVCHPRVMVMVMVMTQSKKERKGCWKHRPKECIRWSAVVTDTHSQQWKTLIYPVI